VLSFQTWKLLPRVRPEIGLGAISDFPKVVLLDEVTLEFCRIPNEGALRVRSEAWIRL
jgi:hypothetical protein